MLDISKSSLLNLGKTKRIYDRKPTMLQTKAVEILVAEGGKSQAEILRKAGYSDKIISNPKLVFNSPAVMELMESAGIDPTRALRQLNEHLTSRKYRVMILNHSVNEPPSEEEIEKITEEIGWKLMRVERGLLETRLMLSSNDTYTQLDAIEKIINIFGIYAPKKIETKNDHRVGVFSMADLRKNMQENGFELKPPKNEAPQGDMSN